MSTAVQVVTDALSVELRLILTLAGQLTKAETPIADADTMIADTAAVVVRALADAGHITRPWQDFGDAGCGEP